MSRVTLSLLLQTALLIYFQVHEWIHLPPWNDNSAGNPQRGLDVVLGVAQAGIIAGVAREWSAAMVVGIAMYGGWLALQVAGWWIPYLYGASKGHMRFYEQHWARTWKFLPAIGDHPVPNAAHVILQLLLLGALVSTVAALVQAV